MLPVNAGTMADLKIRYSDRIRPSARFHEKPRPLDAVDWQKPVSASYEPLPLHFSILSEPTMSIVHIVAVLAIMQFILFGLLVGKAREQHGVKAPAVHGNEEFERVYRVQMNTLEQLICFLPALFMASAYWSPTLMALIGCVYLAGRFIYSNAYVADPNKRGLGFALTILPTVILLAAALLGAIMASF